jgi:hypothetical protein
MRMSEAMRYNDGKPKLSYFMRSFPRMAEAIARVKEMGGIKYEEGNWKKGNKPDAEYWDSMFRHLNAVFTGEEYDKDSGCLHIAHAVWNMCALHELNSTSPPIDEVVFQERALHWAKVREEREAEIDKTEPTCQGFCPDCTCDECCDPTVGLGAGPEITFTPGVPYPLLPPVSKACDIMFEIKNDGKTESFKKLEKSLLDQHVQNLVAEAEARAEAMAVEVAIAQVTEDSKARVEKSEYIAQVKADVKSLADALRKANDMGLLCLTQEEMNEAMATISDGLREANNASAQTLSEMGATIAEAVDKARAAEAADAIELDALAKVLSKNEKNMEDCVEAHTPDALVADKDRAAEEMAWACGAEQTRWDQEEEV